MKKKVKNKHSLKPMSPNWIRCSTNLQQLFQKGNIIIANADKKGAVVIMNMKNYTYEANWQLEITDFYKKIPNDPIEFKRNKVNN